MKHVKTFENFTGSLNEAKGMGPKLTKVWNKYKSSDIEATLGDDLQGFYDDEELDQDCVNAIDTLGKAKDQVDFSTVNGGEEDFEDFFKDLDKAGLKAVEYFTSHGGPGAVVVNA
jgi:hypothetical protein